MNYFVLTIWTFSKQYMNAKNGFRFSHGTYWNDILPFQFPITSLFTIVCETQKIFNKRLSVSIFKGIKRSAAMERLYHEFHLMHGRKPYKTIMFDSRKRIFCVHSCIQNCHLFQKNVHLNVNLLLLTLTQLS